MGWFVDQVTLYRSSRLSIVIDDLDFRIGFDGGQGFFKANLSMTNKPEREQIMLQETQI